MLQVGIEPKRLLNEIKQNNISNVVAGMPVSKGMEIMVADADTQVIEGATDKMCIRDRDMNEYMLDQYHQAYKVATDICKNLEGCIGHKLDETETGYLAMHIQRVYKDAV